MAQFVRRAGSVMRFILPSVLLLLALPAGAQEASAPDMVPRRLLLTVAAGPSSPFSANDLLMVSRSVLLRLQLASTEIAVVEAGPQSGGTNAAFPEAEMRAAGADCFLSLTLSGTWSALRVHATSRDLAEKITVLNATIQREGWSSSQDIADEGWDEIVRPVAQGYHAVAAAAAVGTGPALARLTVRALPGTILLGPEGSQQKKVGKNGLAAWDVPVLRQYSLTARLAGYHPVTESIFLTSDREIDLQQVKDPTWSFEAALVDMSIPGIEISRAVIPGVAFVRLGLATSLITLDLSAPGLFGSDPLSVLSLQFGLYFTSEDAFVRLYAGVGAFARLVHPLGVAPFLDQLAPAGVAGVFGGEIFPSSRGAFFVEWTPRVYKTDFPDLLKAALGTGDPRPGWFIGTNSAAELLSMRIGYRWNL